jgi:hypothetical protein
LILATVSNVAAPRWVIAAVCALAGYLVVMSAFLVLLAGQGGEELRELNGQAATIAALMLGLPTVVLAVLLFISRAAHPVGAIAVAWMAFSAFVWFPVELVIAAVAAGVALVVLGAMLADWSRVQVGRTRDRPQE